MNRNIIINSSRLENISRISVTSSVTNKASSHEGRTHTGDSYCRTLLCVISMGITHGLIGAVNISVFLYSMKAGDGHEALYSAAFGMTDADTASKVTVNSKLKSTGSKASLRFAAPLKARVIENIGHNYFMTVWSAMALGLSHVFTGALVMAMSFYSFYRGEFHAILYSLAYHFFSAEAIMTLSYINGWSAPMRYKHRKFVHIFLQLCGLSCASVATAVVLASKRLSDTAHVISGLITLILTIMAAVSGVFALRSKLRGNVLLHMMFGIPCFTLSTICLIFGLMTEEFKKWAGMTIVYILLGFVVFYTSVIIITTGIKCIQKM